MRRSYAISDYVSRLTHSIRRNRLAVLIYVLICALFLVVGIAVGANMTDKTDFVLRNGAGIFKYLRGDIGIVAFFFIDLIMSCVYCIFSASMFFNRIISFLSAVPCAYRAYVLGLNVSVIIVVFSVSSLPMLFVVFVPVCIVEVVILCLISFRCMSFVSLNCGVFPSKIDIKEYYLGLLRYLFAVAVLAIAKAITLVLFGSALIGVI